MVAVESPPAAAVVAAPGGAGAAAVVAAPGGGTGGGVAQKINGTRRAIASTKTTRRLKLIAFTVETVFFCCWRRKFFCWVAVQRSCVAWPYSGSVGALRIFF